MLNKDESFKLKILPANIYAKVFSFPGKITTEVFIFLRY